MPQLRRRHTRSGASLSKKRIAKKATARNHKRLIREVKTSGKLLKPKKLIRAKQPTAIAVMRTTDKKIKTISAPIIIDTTKFESFPVMLESTNFLISESDVIGQGIGGIVVRACTKPSKASIPRSKAADCTYVAKFIPLPKNTSMNARNVNPTSGMSACLSPLEAAIAELTITKLMAQIGVAPKVHEAFIQSGPKPRAVIIMDQYDGTLEQLWSRLRSKAEQAVVLSKVLQLVQLMHSSGIVHTDLWGANIVYRFRSILEFAIIDYGKAVFSTDPIVKERDFELWDWNLQNIGFHKTSFIRDGIPCGPWWG